MKFDIYQSIRTREGRIVPGVTPQPMEWSGIVNYSKSDEVKKKIADYRAGNKDAKTSLPAICYVGRTSKTRAAANMTPTQLVMVDVDHVEDPLAAWKEVMAAMDDQWRVDNLMIAHITPSGKGLRFVFVAQPQFTTLEDNMAWFSQEFNLSKYGKFDAPCKDFSRISFMFQESDLLYQSAKLLTEQEPKFEIYLKNDFDNQTSVSTEQAGNYPTYTDDEKIELDGYDYRGTPVKKIIEKWVEVNGKPGKSEIHNYYNEMVKYFRNITSNDKRVLFYLLPRFGHTGAECWSQIESICRVNTLSSLPKPFYFFLKDNGFYKRENVSGSLASYMMSEDDTTPDMTLPPFPPVFRELVNIAPKDFKLAAVNALLPIMGTLTSYLQGKYYFDNRLHTTSFFSIIYAPAGTGKGFAERYINLLFNMLRLRDYVQTARENVYLSVLQRKGANDKAPESPHTSLRIIPAKNSEAEFLQKQRDNHGYHMFTYAAEMDSWAKGVKAAGGNKDDMLRVAWDNGSYGQKFRSSNTFNGEVNLYWNVLISGTIQQIENYFKNVENGLITRCSFTTIPNQEFAEAPIWKELNKKSLDTIRKFMERCDENSYEEPCTLLPEEIDCIKDDDFDKEVDWQFHFRERKTVDMQWLKSTIVDFLEEQRKRASLDVDHARDVFRRRCAVRGFRLGLICNALWNKPTQKQLLSCIPFIKWWMHEDLEASLDLWGARYNNATEEVPTLTQRNVFTALPQQFTKSDVYTLCMKQGVKTRVSMVVHQWKKLNVIEQVAKNEYKKLLKNE